MNTGNATEHHAFDLFIPSKLQLAGFLHSFSIKCDVIFKQQHWTKKCPKLSVVEKKKVDRCLNFLCQQWLQARAFCSSESDLHSIQEEFFWPFLFAEFLRLRWISGLNGSLELISHHCFTVKVWVLTRPLQSLDLSFSEAILRCVYRTCCINQLLLSFDWKTATLTLSCRTLCLSREMLFPLWQQVVQSLR